MSDLRPTPETDKAATISCLESTYGMSGYVETDFTRTLERQRDEAREDAERLAAHVEKWREELEESCGGRGRIAELGIELDLAAHRNLTAKN